MSHQTGIKANEKLTEFLAKCRDGSIRLMKISITDEQLDLDDYKESSGSWEEDYDTMVLPQLMDKQPCYLMYRLDSQHEGSYQWIFICWSPDFSPIREKMLYASTKATLKNEFGGGQIKDELFGTVKDDVCLKGYKSHVVAGSAPAPLTEREEELKEIRRVEVGTDISVDTKHQTIQGVAFPISDEAINSLFDMRDEKYSYLQFSIDLTNEKVNLEYADHTNIDRLPSRIPKDHARYHVFAFPHTFEGDFMRSLVFIYTNPGYNCTIKERMLYSSCKNPVVEVIEQKIGILLAKKIEIDDPSELTEEFLFDEIHPKKNIYKQKFSKPKGPPNRGARRITKQAPES